MLLVALFAAFVQDPARPDLTELLSRVSEEAEVFQQNAAKTLTVETLEQRALMPASRFRPRIGKKAVATVPPPRLVVRQIVSEYSVGTLQESPRRNLTELRQVVSVDGRKVQSSERARHALSLGIVSPDDRVRKRMLEDFAAHGLVDIATDYGLLLLAFNKRGLEQMKVEFAGEEQVGADSAWVLNWAQTSPDDGLLAFVGSQASRRALQGRLFIRKSDGLPIRIQSWTGSDGDDLNARLKEWSGKAAPAPSIRDEATVEYVRSAHGFMTPVSVSHRHLVDRQVVTENLYRYEPFKMFGADADIKFTELESSPPTSAPVKK